MGNTNHGQMDPRYQESYRIFEHAKTLLPGGVTKARVAHVPGRYPIYMERARGSHVWDVDGNEYVDWMSGYGCILLGHRCEEVDQAAVRQMEKGFTSFLSNPLQNELAQRLIDMFPCAETVRFFKTGTDATTAAVRIARIHTGRDRVIRWGFHGWADWSVANFYGFDVGVPQVVRDLTLAMEYNNLDSLRGLFADNPGEIACVIMMPFEIDPPEKGFLEGVKQLCHENGAVLIFDEIRSGFRMAPGGAQEYFGVTPDLTSLSKAMGNGYPIAAVVGSREVMQAVEQGLFSATFFVSSLEMAACMATLDIIERDGVIERIWQTGRSFQDGLRQVFADSALKVDVVGYPPFPFLQFGLADDKLNEQVKSTFYAEVAARGVYFHPNHHWFVNFSHTAEDVARTLEACEAALKVAEESMDSHAGST